MRKVLIGLLLAGAAASPAIAGPHNNNHQQAKEERQQARQVRVQAREDARSERSNDRSDRPSFSGPRFRPQAQPQARMVDRPQFDRAPRMAPQMNMDAVRAQREASAAQRNAYAQQQRQQRVEQMRDRVEQRQERQQEVRDARELRQQNRVVSNGVRDRRTPPVVSTTPRPGTQPPLRAEGSRHGRTHWNTNWRNDHRYDWRTYRHHHRSLFHLGFYYDPYGWGYQPFSIGWRLWPGYYSSQFWIRDPWTYRLPYAPPGYVWVRYWNDALLVDQFTGEVVDMLPGFFW